MEREKRLYQAIIWRRDHGQLGERTTVIAYDLEDAEKELKNAYGDDIVFSLYNEEDASKSR